MSLVDALLPEFDHEMTTTRKLLERVPEDQLDWRPHDRSMSLGGLVTHLANLATWGLIALDRSELDVGGAAPLTPITSRRQLLETFDRNAAATRGVLCAKSDAELMVPWALKRDGKTMFSMPKASVWRSFVLNHLIHHRGQLSVYLRLRDVPLPSIYGPSADEGAL
jgi:uncharacterized damage-inducible protein DinB